jgi:hypothetical protein
MESLRIGVVPKPLKFMRGTKLRCEKMTQLLSPLHSWEIHAEQGRYHASRLSFSGRAAAREGFASRFAPKYRGNPKHSKAESRRWQNCIDERGLGTRQLAGFLIGRETYAQAMMLRRRGLL